MIQIVKSIGSHTIQDQGRIGYQSLGVPVSGPMDEDAFIIANYLVLNSGGDAVIELSTGRLSLLFSNTNMVAITGFAIARVNGVEVPSWRTIQVSSGDVLDIQIHPSGNYAYLSIAGGWKQQLWLNSASTFLPLGIGKAIKRGRRLNRAGDVDERIHAFSSFLKSKEKKYASWSVSESLLPQYFTQSIQVIPGNEINLFTADSIHLFTQNEFSVHLQKNRMAYVIENAMLERISSEELSSVTVQKGTIQVTPNSTLYLLMSDCQTLGGYPRIGQIAAVDLPIIAQMTRSRAFQFNWIKVEEAVEQLRKRQKELEYLQLTLENKFLTYAQ